MIRRPRSRLGLTALLVDLVGLTGFAVMTGACSDDDGASTSPGEPGTTSPAEPETTRAVSTLGSRASSVSGGVPTSTSTLAGGTAITTTSKGGDGHDTAEPSPTVGISELTVLTMPDLTDPVGVVDDVVIDECQLEQGAVRATGTAINSDDSDSDIAITIIWKLNDSDDPISHASTMLEDVGAGDQIEWTVETEIERAAERCVINARRGST